MIKFVCNKCKEDIPSKEVHKLVLTYPNQDTRIMHFHEQCLPNLEGPVEIIKLEEIRQKGKRSLSIEEVARIMGAYYITGKNITKASQMTHRSYQVCLNYVHKFSTDKLDKLWGSEVSSVEFKGRYCNVKTLVNLFAQGWEYKKILEECTLVDVDSLKELLSIYTGVKIQ